MECFPTIIESELFIIWRLFIRITWSNRVSSIEKDPWIFHEHYEHQSLLYNWFYTGLAAAIYAPTTGVTVDIRTTQTFTCLLIISWITFYLPIIVKRKTLVFNTWVTVEYERHCQFQARSSQNVTCNSRQTIQIFRNGKKLTETHDGSSIGSNQTHRFQIWIIFNVHLNNWLFPTSEHWFQSKNIWTTSHKITLFLKCMWN